MKLSSGMWVVVLIVVCIWGWLGTIATSALRADPGITRFQRAAQFWIIWLIPIFGAIIVLNMVHHHAPEVIRHDLLPKFVRRFLFGRPPKRNRNRSELDMDGENIQSARKSRSRNEEPNDAIDIDD